MGTRAICAYAFLSFGFTAFPVSAQTVTPTSGAVSLLWDGSLTGFQLNGGGSQLNGEVMIPAAHRFTAGTRGDLNEVVSTTNQSNHTFLEVINGTSQTAWIKAQFTFTTQPMSIPFAADGARATFSTPFTVTGQFRGYSDKALTNQVFSVSVQGSGIASALNMRYDATSQTWSFVGGYGEVFAFTDALPAPWASADIGAVGVAGVSSYDTGNKIFEVAGAGGDIWGTADAFQFVSRPLPADGSIVARVTGEQMTSFYAKAGVMIRQSGEPASAHVLLDVLPGGNIEFMTRTSTGASTTFLAGATVTSPPWLKLTRTGDTVTAALSTDGASWTTLGTASLHGRASIGLAVTSHDSTVLNQATFDLLTVAAASATGGSLPISWSDADIGAVGNAGSASESGGTFTVTGSGANIWGTADAFHFASTPMNSNGEIQARVVSEDNTNAFAKAGVMFRDSLDPGATHVILDVKPDGWVEFMTRESPGGSTRYVTGIQKSFPVSLKLTRVYGSVNSIVIAFVFDTSSNAWQQIGWVQVPMGPGATAGLAVTSRDSTLLNSGVFDSVYVQKNLLVEGSFEGYSRPALGPPGWISDTPFRQVDAVTDTHPDNGYQNGACIQTTYRDCGLYQEVTAPADASYTLTIFAAADRPGGLVGVNVNGQTMQSADAPADGHYLAAPSTLHFTATAGAIIRVWMYSPASPGYVRIDDVELIQDSSLP